MKHKKRIIKSFLAFVCTFVMCLSIASPTYALDSNSTLEEKNKNFINKNLEYLLESKEIYDENGNNITDWFNQKFKSLYNEGNKEAIVNDLYNKNYRYVADDAHEELSKARTGGSSQKKVYNSTQTVNTSLGFIKYQSYAILYISNSSNKITSYTVYVILKSNETGCKKSTFKFINQSTECYTEYGETRITSDGYIKFKDNGGGERFIYGGALFEIFTTRVSYGHTSSCSCNNPKRWTTLQ